MALTQTKKRNRVVLLSVAIMVLTLMLGGILGYAVEEDVTPPIISQIIIDKQIVVVGDVINVFIYAEDESGIHTGMSANQVVLTRVKEDETEADRSKYAIIEPTSEPGKYVATYSVGSSFAEGDYYVSSVTLYDKAGNRAYISQYTDKNNLLPKEKVTVKSESDDVAPPTISRITVEEKTVTGGDTIDVFIYAEDESGIHTGMSANQVVLTRVKEDETEADRSKYAIIEPTSEPGKYVATYSVGSSFAEGDYYVSSVTLYDKAGNRAYISQYTDKNNLLPKEKVTVKSESDDVAPPTISRITVEEKTVTDGDTIDVFIYAEDESGIHTGMSANQVVLTRVKEDETEADRSKYAIIEPTSESGKYVATYSVDSSFAKGDYYVSSVTLYDKAGNRAYISQYTDKNNLLPKERVSVVITDTSNSTTESTKSTTESTRSTTESTKSTTESTKATTESTKSTTESTKSTTESTKSTTESTKSTTESTKSTTESTKSTTESTKSTTESTKSTTGSTKSTTKNTKADANNSSLTTNNNAAFTRTTTRTIATTRLNYQNSNYNRSTTNNRSSVTQKTGSSVDTSDPSHLPIWLAMGIIAIGAYALTAVWKEE